jgi:5-formyltetrahydrofolate cyclo-ligase
MVKKEIRKEYNAKRLALSEQQVNDMTAHTLENFRSIRLEGVQLLLSYYPIAARKEFNVALCEQLHLLNNPSAEIAWPKLQPDLVTMEAIVINEKTVLAKNRFDIFEPTGEQYVQPQMIDAVFVPLLAFDIKGYRVGYGKGFYDRYLARCAQDVVKIGFSFFEALESIDDINEFDVPLNYCITPSRVYEF